MNTLDIFGAWVARITSWLIIAIGICNDDRPDITDYFSLCVQLIALLE